MGDISQDLEIFLCFFPHFEERNGMDLQAEMTGT
jgi:hypothetical protein